MTERTKETHEKPKAAAAAPAKQADPVKAENQRATLIVRKVPVTLPGQAQRYLVHAVANTLEFTVGQGLTEDQVKQLTASPDIHVTVTA